MKPGLGVVVALCLVAGLISSAVAAAGGMHSAGFSIPWSALNAGSQRMASAQWHMHGTVPLGTIQSAHSSHFGLHSGYWPGALQFTAPIAPEWHVYLPLLLRGH